VWAALEEHRRLQLESGEREARRRAQEVRAFWTLVEEGLRARFDESARVQSELGPLLEKLGAGAIDAGSAADAILAAFAAASAAEGA
jgi:putative protein kinase ArgK-like GTPase of G3E family